MALRDITLRINGKTYTGRAEPRKTLADFIREDCGLTGTHLGCEHGVCGACTILVDGDAVRSCLLFAVQAEAADLLTVEGLAQGDTLHPLQQAFWEHHALQCGFCTPGFLMTALAFLRETPHPTEREIREGLAGNLCRCTGYHNIVKAVAAAAALPAEALAAPVPAPDAASAARGATETPAAAGRARRTPRRAGSARRTAASKERSPRRRRSKP
jgi:aerobic carbon-monoxide dehydrogenase small subunit